jgi:hypothetical protein
MVDVSGHQVHVLPMAERPDEEITNQEACVGCVRTISSQFLECVRLTSKNGANCLPESLPASVRLSDLLHHAHVAICQSSQRRRVESAILPCLRAVALKLNSHALRKSITNGRLIPVIRAELTVERIHARRLDSCGGK